MKKGIPYRKLYRLQSFDRNDAITRQGSLGPINRKIMPEQEKEQPRSQGSLLPALRTWERGWKRNTEKQEEGGKYRELVNGFTLRKFNTI